MVHEYVGWWVLQLVLLHAVFVLQRAIGMPPDYHSALGVEFWIPLGNAQR
jgi:hypothetical protein